MELVLEELQKSLDYHQRQLEDNLRKIEMFTKSSEKHKQTIEEIEKVMEMVKG